MKKAILICVTVLAASAAAGRACRANRSLTVLLAGGAEANAITIGSAPTAAAT